MPRKFNKLNKSDKWNYPLEKAIEIIHENLINILRENESMMEVPQIIHLLNRRGKKDNFKKYGKRKDVIVYINEYFSSLITFADSYEIYCVIYKDKKAYIKLNEEIDFNGKNIKKKEIVESWSWDFIDVPPIIELN
tara:strand:- start:81 stop:488 length:408 start_codon:yes stop_codon:yes gene_type:complete